MAKKVKIDMNYVEFQRDLFSLEKVEQYALLNTLRKISEMDWDQLYQHRGLRWEEITSKRSITGRSIYSFRFSKKYRATALRESDFLVLLTLHPDHDSTYE